MAAGEVNEKENLEDSLFQSQKVPCQKKSSECSVCAESDKCDERSCEGKVGHLFVGFRK